MLHVPYTVRPREIPAIRDFSAVYMRYGIIGALGPSDQGCSWDSDMVQAWMGGKDGRLRSKAETLKFCRGVGSLKPGDSHSNEAGQRL